MKPNVQHIEAVTHHIRRGEVPHSFCYSVDYVLIDMDALNIGPQLFSRNKFNLFAVHDRHHGGIISQGKGAEWAHEVLGESGFQKDEYKLLLLTQPSLLGFVFNPVSFWLAMKDHDLIAVIAEVSTPFGDRHSYLCCNEDHSPIKSNDRIKRQKMLHVSPYQLVAGDYEFGFDIRADQVAIRILHRRGKEGIVATLAGSVAPLTNSIILKATVRRPFGALRTTALIYWQALVLKLKGATYRTRPTPPHTEVSK